MVKNLPAMWETQVLSLGWEDPGEENGYPLQYSCLENSTGRGAWWSIVHGVTKSWTLLNNLHFFWMIMIARHWRHYWLALEECWNCSSE